MKVRIWPVVTAVSLSSQLTCTRCASAVSNSVSLTINNEKAMLQYADYTIVSKLHISSVCFLAGVYSCTTMAYNIDTGNYIKSNSALFLEGYPANNNY